MIPAHAGPVARLVATSILVAVAVAGSFLALTGLVVPGPWVTEGLVGIALVAGTAALVRGLLEGRARRRRGDVGTWAVVPTLAAGAVAAWFVLSRFGAATSDPDLLVGPAHVLRAVGRLADGAEIIRSEVAPVPGTLPIVLIAIGGTLTVLLLADALAGGLHRPAAAGLPLLALWAPTLVLVGEVPRGVFLVVVVALLLLLTIPVPRDAPVATRTPATVRRAERSRAMLTTASAVVVALCAALVAAASSSLPSYAGAWYQAFTTSGDAIQLSEDLDVLGSLTERSDEVVLTYTGPEEDAGPLRTYTASAFDGRHWQRGDERPGEPFDGEDVLWPDDVSGGGVPPQELAVSIGSLREDQLPVPVDPRTVDVDGTWGYDPVRDEVVGDRTDQGTTYTIGVRPRALDPDDLRDAGPGTTEDAYLEVPQTDHSTQVAELAAEVVGDAPTAYDQAVELQRWLRDPGSFTYSTELPRGGTGDPVWDFLQHRTGYCVQFATTMTVMARTLGIPARLGVGFLPGDPVDAPDAEQPVWQVTGQDSHAWPELYFEGAGWVRFEPTPAVQTGPPPRHTEPRTSTTADPAAPQEVPTAEAVVPDAPTANPQPTASVAGSGTVATEDGAPVWLWLSASIALLVVAGSVWLLVARGRRRDDGPLDAERAWQRVVSALARDGVRLPPSTTPRQAPQAVIDAVTAREGAGEPSQALRAGLATLSTAVEDSRYAAEGDPIPDTDLAAVADQVVSELTGLRGGARPSVR